MTRFFKFAPLALLVISACGFGPGNLIINQSPDIGKREVRRITILALDPPSLPEERIAPPRSAQAIKARAKERAAGSILTELLYRTVSELPVWRLVSEREVKEVEPSISADLGSAERARKLGELVYAEMVLFGRVLHFKERVGEQLGVQSPASVGFVLQLLDVKRGDIIWSARFEETQKPLTQDLFGLRKFTQRGARWLTAEELALEGVRDALGRLSEALYHHST